ncbi:MAG: hypothetical protein DME34_05640 [Verrucomicrobia bacterium]|nr:MAG: hypothetical protein DME34_05640 [Verrucomicrobiota bacterium]
MPQSHILWPSGSPCAKMRSARQRKSVGEPVPSSGARERQIDINSASDADSIERSLLSMFDSPGALRPSLTGKFYDESACCGKSHSAHLNSRARM